MTMANLFEDVCAGLQSRHNALFFSLRNFLRRGGGPYQERFEEKASLFTGHGALVSLADRRAALHTRYDLATFEQRCTRQRYQEALTYLDYLDRLHEQQGFLREAFSHHETASGTLSWLDVGAKNWAYVDGLFAFLNAHMQEPEEFTGGLSLHGVELDGYRRYTDGHHRAEYAQAYISAIQNDINTRRDIKTRSYLPVALGQCSPAHPTGRQPGQAHDAILDSSTQSALASITYEVRDVLAVQGCYQVISCFLPFVFKAPCLAWGLPECCFNPEGIFRHLLRLLDDNGWLVLVNQGDDEAEEQRRLLTQLQAETSSMRLVLHDFGAFPASFLSFEYPRYGLLCQKRSRTESTPLKVL